MKKATILAAIMLTAPLATAHAQSAAEFYRDKVINLYIGYGPGGGYDLYARTLAKHMVRHIPGAPRILPTNMPGASSMTLANYVAKIAPKDGLAFGAVNSALIFDPLFSGTRSKAQFNAPDMTMIGNIVSSASVLVSWHTSGVKTIDDIRAKGLTIAATSPSGDTYLLPLSVKNILGLDKLKLITGYPGSREVAIALEQNEVAGRVWDMEGIKSTRPDWLRDNKLNIVAQLAPHKMPEVPADVPLVKDYVISQEDKDALDVIFLSTTLARPYIAPPEIPQDRAKALRDAFMATMKDPEFAADLDKLSMNVDATSGEDMQKIVKDAYSLPAATVEKVRRALTAP
jgi:tripartite-type tricarboxylate transporter receptor subunit TctC